MHYKKNKDFYMKLAFILTSLLFPCFSIADPLDPTSVSVRNVTSSSVMVWINGSERKLAPDSGVIVPCNTEETVELQVNEQIEFILCGEHREVSQ
jgi:hypothetical protein